jgi:hypothetical protein
MRAKEFILEDHVKGHISDNMKHAGTHAIKLGNEHYYDHYRVGLAMAGAPDLKTPKHGPAEDNAHVWMYSDADEKIAKSAMKQHGIKGKTMVPKGSHEHPLVNKQSPVVQRKKNKYGV